MDQTTPSQLTPLQVCKFLCGVAWADADITPEEKRYITNLAELLSLREDQMLLVRGWFHHPPDPHDITPSRLTYQDRQNLLQQALILVSEDGQFCADEERLITVLARSLRIPADEMADLQKRVAELFKALPVYASEELPPGEDDADHSALDFKTSASPLLDPTQLSESIPSLSGFSWEDALAASADDDLLGIEMNADDDVHGERAPTHGEHGTPSGLHDEERDPSDPEESAEENEPVEEGGDKEIATAADTNSERDTPPRQEREDTPSVHPNAADAQTHGDHALLEEGAQAQEGTSSTQGAPADDADDDPQDDGTTTTTSHAESDTSSDGTGKNAQDNDAQDETVGTLADNDQQVSDALLQGDTNGDTNAESGHTNAQDSDDLDPDNAAQTHTPSPDHEASAEAPTDTQTTA
ncbi:MAG: hypothetical protein AAFS10_20130 [Myxococcota bacterium]